VADRAHRWRFVLAEQRIGDLIRDFAWFAIFLAARAWESA